jgi:outer membrane protein assembly factor BamB
MKNKYGIVIKWDTIIPSSQVLKCGVRGGLPFLENRSVMLSFNEQVEGLLGEKQGKLVRITQGLTEDVFTTNYSLLMPIPDGNDIYLIALKECGVNTGYGKSILYKFDEKGIIKWRYNFKFEATTLPVFSSDSIFLTDFNSQCSRGNLYRLSKNGELIFKKQIDGYPGIEPYILEERNELILCINRPLTLELRDLDGNIIKTKNRNGVFSRNALGQIYAALSNSISRLDEELNTLWEYKPEKGIITNAPVFDSEGNAYTYLYPARLVSLDPAGKERWIANLFGLGRTQPSIIANDHILTITSINKDKPREEDSMSVIEIFSKQGKKIAEHPLAGHYVYHVINEDRLFVVTGGTFHYPEEEKIYFNTRVYCLGLQEL